MKDSTQKLKEFQKKIWKYYKEHKRVFLWRNIKNPYHILVSEIMLQQTQTDRVIEKYKEFLKTFPNIQSLAIAPLRDVLLAWSGLGYNRRAKMLKQTSEIIVKKYKGKIPKDQNLLLALPGIGKATAGAICAFAFNIPSIFIETNIRRAYIYFFFKKDNTKVHDRDIALLLEKTIDIKNPREWYYALTDYGAMLGAKERYNPNIKSAHYNKQSKFIGSDRQIRGKIIKLLLSDNQLSFLAISKKIKEPLVRIKKIMKDLQSEQFISIKNDQIRII